MTTIHAGDNAYLMIPNPDGEMDPNWFIPVRISSIGTREDGSEYADYVARGFGARSNLDQFIPRTAVKRVNVNGRRRLIWR